MTILVYEKIVDGEAIKLPELRVKIESIFPGHAAEVHRILTLEGMTDWKIRFMPWKKGYAKGVIVQYLKLIFIMQQSKKEMLVTLYHEILHFQKPHMTEEMIEKTANKMYLCR